MWNLNERDGKIDQAKGKAKQAVGDLTGNDQLKTEGKIDETRGNAKAAFGGAQRKVGAAVASLSQPVKR
ncbi:MAG TPA: CsbD family protein [Vicinamibacterales bacterium]|nr:CsbD family protein [Vicinamibacterales bacterium]